jgi:acetylglutamate kinase
MGGNVVGLCGTDSNMVQAHLANERLGLVGEIDL